MKSIYDQRFFKDHHAMTVHAARTIVPLVLEALPPVHSAVDLGCGVGTWLSVLIEHGVEDVLGLDGSWVGRELLEIPETQFREADMEGDLSFERKFDLAIALEVAEHLSPEKAETFVGSLTRAADFVVFSAAVPYQGGEGHLNEQWPDYWAELFERQGFDGIDLVRQRVWTDPQIPVWYRQNILLFVRSDQRERLSLPALDGATGRPLALVHPELYLLRLNQMSSLRGGWKSLRRGLRALVLRSTGRR